MKTFAVTRVPEHHGHDSAADPFLLLIDRQPAGGTYLCEHIPAAAVGWDWNDGSLPPGASWASWGPRGLSSGHLTREAAEQAQVREYVTNPDLFDRLLRDACILCGLTIPGCPHHPRSTR